MFRLENNVIITEEKEGGEGISGGIGHVCFKYMSTYSEKIAQIDVATGKAETFRFLLKKCRRTSIVLQKHGIKRRDIITYYSKIHMDACVPLVASFFIGAIPSFVDDALLPSDVKHLLKQLKPKLLLTDREYLQKMKDVCEEANIDTDIVVFDDSFLQYQQEEVNFHPIYVDDLNEMAAIYFSSGSTGLPKGICLNHYRLLCFDVLAEEGLFKKGQNKVAFSHDSFYWTVEMMRFISSLRQGVCRLISTDLDAKEIWYIMEKYKVNVACLIPYDIIGMCVCGKPPNLSLSSLTTIYSEGAPLPKKYQLALEEMLPHVDVYRYYGQTEIGTLAMFTKSDLHRTYNREKYECTGVPFDGVGTCYKVADLDSGKALGPNKPGELCVKGKTVMLGYLNQVAADRFDEDGFLKTGDIVFYDEDFCFYITGRVKDVIIFRGWHISPATLENELLGHPGVANAVVIGVPHSRDGERPLGVVVLDPKSNVTREEIERYVRAEVPERPMEVKIVKEIPVTVTGKAKRGELRKMFCFS